MSRSTAKFLAYDLRPAKQTERRIIMDVLRLSRSAQLDTSHCTYVGMGGIKFYDFEMLHRYLGIRSMISIEHDDAVHTRCEFNKPFGFITIEGKSVSEFIDQYKFEGPTIVWLDYDGGLNKGVTSDLIALGSKIRPGSFVFITVGGQLAPAVHSLSPKERVEHYREELGPLALNCNPEDVEPDKHHRYVERVISAALSSAFASRADGKFEALLRIIYKDSTWMATAGGCFCNAATLASIKSHVQSELPFLLDPKLQPYQLLDLNLTAKERALLDHVVTATSPRSDDIALLKKLDFGKEKIDAYRNVVRFLPRYVETFM